MQKQPTNCCAKTGHSGGTKYCMYVLLFSCSIVHPGVLVPRIVAQTGGSVGITLMRVLHDHEGSACIPYLRTTMNQESKSGPIPITSIYLMNISSGKHATGMHVIEGFLFEKSQHP